MSDNIPFDLQKEIMKRLPVKSLILFRSVSKPWKTFIDSPEFIAAHRPQIHRLLLRYRNALNGAPHYLSFLDDGSFGSPMIVPVPPKPLLIQEDLRIFGSSRGLFCLWGEYRYEGNSYHTNIAIIWNPSIRKYVAIDVPNVGYKTVVGFGVCHNNPKLVKITYVKFKNMSSNSIPPWQVEVFTLSSKSWTRVTSTNLPRGSIRVTWSQVVIDGFIYWLGFDKMSTDGEVRTCHLIISFDMTSEEFKVVDLPDSLSHQPLDTLCISRLKESLVVLQRDVNNAARQVWAVWVMDHVVPNSFTKLYTIKAPNASIKTVLGFTKTGASIVGVEEDAYLMADELFVFEPDSELISEFGICAAEYSFFMNTYTETLLLLDH